MKMIVAAAALIAMAVPAVAQQLADGPPWDISGDWSCSERCMPGKSGAGTQVIQDGAHFVFVNEAGAPFQAEWRFDGQISFTNCDDAAILSSDQGTLTFLNGSVWVRSVGRQAASDHPPAPEVPVDDWYRWYGGS